MKRLILTVLAAGAVGAAAAQECGEPMTLQRCLELGLEQNYDVRIIPVSYTHLTLPTN